MPLAEIYRTNDGYIIKTSDERNYALIRGKNGFMKQTLSSGKLPPFQGTLVKGIPNEIKRDFFALQKQG